LTVREAVAGASLGERDLARASERAALETGGPQHVGLDVPGGGSPFADDTAPRDALVAVPDGQGDWAIGESLFEARARAAKVQGRRTTAAAGPPLLDRLPPVPEGGVALATSWVEPAYLEPDASWCEPGGEPATPLANGGAFGGKCASDAPRAAQELANKLGRTVRVVYAREDVVRLGPKRPPIAAVAVARDGVVHIDGVIAAGAGAPPAIPGVEARWREVDIAGPPVSLALRAAGVAEQWMLAAGALGRAVEVVSARGARATAHVDDAGIHVALAAGDPLDETVLRSYAIGAAHMAYSWVTSEQLTVDPETGEVHDLTIRSFGVVRAADTPAITVEILDDPAPARAQSTDAVFCAVAAATWNARGRPVTLPTRVRT
jgi:hypothetical protein